MKRLFALAIHRAECLKSREKPLVAELIDTEAFFLSLSVDDLSQIVGRVINTTIWDPPTLLREAEADIRYLDRHNLAMVSVLESEYPPLLRNTFDPPFLLFVRGRLANPERPSVAIVGTRSPNAIALRAAFQLAREFASIGIPIVSGLALGIDAAAHSGALSGNGITVAVLGSGIDMVYPFSNRGLAHRILDSGGGIVSEYPPGVPPTKYHFPERNRIISGLCRSVVVAQAPNRSGALITADFAIEQGRDLYILADGMATETGAGGAALAHEGALVVGSVADVLADWSGLPPGELPSNSEGSVTLRGNGASTGRQLALQLEQELEARAL